MLTQWQVSMQQRVTNWDGDCPRITLRGQSVAAMVCGIRSQKLVSVMMGGVRDIWGWNWMGIRFSPVIYAWVQKARKPQGSKMGLCQSMLLVSIVAGHGHQILLERVEWESVVSMEIGVCWGSVSVTIIVLRGSGI